MTTQENIKITIDDVEITPVPTFSYKKVPAIWLRYSHLPYGTKVWCRDKYHIQNDEKIRHIKITKMTEIEASAIDEDDFFKIK